MQTGDTVSFAFCLPTFAFPGSGLFRVPAWDRLDSSLLLDAAVAADRGGFDAIWVADHYMIGQDDAVLDGWTTLAAVAGATRKARLSLIQGSMLFRHPAQFAKMIATLDQLSGGRVTVFSSMGRAMREHVAYGFDWFEAEADRFERFVEAHEILRRLWNDDGAISHQGRFFHLDQAVAAPKPLQANLPLWFAGTEDAMLDLAARQGAGWNTPPMSLADVRSIRTRLAWHCRNAGRRIEDLTVSLETQILVRDTIAQLREALRGMCHGSMAPGLNMAEDLVAFLSGTTDAVPQSLTETSLIGTPRMVIEQMIAYRNAGVNDFGLWFLDFPERTGMHLFVSQIAASVQQNAATVRNANDKS